MFNILVIVILASLVIFGWNYAIDYDILVPSDKHPFGEKATNKEILWFIKFYGGRLLYKFHLSFLYKPVFLCPICQASVIGSLVYFLICLTPCFLTWAITVLAVAGFNRLAIKAIQ